MSTDTTAADGTGDPDEPAGPATPDEPAGPATPDDPGAADTPDAADAPDAPAPSGETHGRPPRSGPSASLVLVAATLLTGLLAVVLAALVPFAPVLDRDTTVTWPRSGEQPSSTIAGFVPYAPESVRVTVPCGVLQTAAGREDPTTVVSSEQPNASNIGFTVRTEAGDVRILVGGRELVREPVGGGDCGRVLAADDAGSTVTTGDGAPRSFPGDVVRSVGAFTTELSPADADGLSVTAQTADWFAADATTAKQVLIGAQWVAAAVSLVLLALLAGDRLRPRPGALRLLRARLAEGVRPRGIDRLCADVVVLGTLAVWTVIGPLSTDDGFTEAIARNTGADDFGNVYRWGNASEAPYTLVIRMVQALTADGAGPLMLRVPSVLAGMAVWLLLSRVALPAVLPRHHRYAWVRWVLGAGLLAWWLPLNLGVRPEPFAALFATAALACGLRAAARPGRHGGLWIGGAALASGLALAVTPSAISVAGPLALLVPALWRRLARRGTPGARITAATPLRAPTTGWLVALAGTAAATGIAAAGLVVVFTGQSLYTVLRATEMHQFYGPDVPWYLEVRRWQYLLGDDEQGGLGRRVPVLLSVAMLVAALPLVARRAYPATAGLRRVAVPTAGLAIGFVLLTPAPSKWTHYFGSLAGTGALAIAAGAVLVVAAARHRPDAAVRGTALAGTAAAIVLAALVFSGSNHWFLWSEWGVPRYDGPFTPLNSPVTWVAVAAVLFAAGLAAGLPARHRAPLRTLAARSVAALPAAVVVTAVLTGVAVVVGSMAVAPARQGEGYSVAGQMWDELTGTPTCGILDHVSITSESPGTLAPAEGQDALAGFVDRGHPEDPPAGGTTWGSLAVGGDVGTGTLTSRWYTLPALRSGQQLVVDVAGRTGQGNTADLEFGRGAGTPEPAGRVSLDDTRTALAARADYPTDRVQEDAPLNRPGWRTIRIDPAEIPPGADRVRVRAVDDTTDPGGWVAAAAPRLRTLTPVLPMLRNADGPVYVDWSILWAAPCLRDLPTVRAGLAETPRYLVLGPSSLGFSLDVTFVESVGGTFAAMSRGSTETAIATRVDTADDPDQEDWGGVSRIDPTLARDAYDVRSEQVRRWGWEGDRSPLGYPELPPP